MILQSADAHRITVSSGREAFSRSLGLTQLPVLVLEYPFEIAQHLARHVMPLATPDLAFAGRYLHEDGHITLGVYLVVRTTQPFPVTWVIGNERNLPDDDWRPFCERYGEFGKFVISLGVLTDHVFGSFLTDPPWFLEVKTFYHEDIRPKVFRAVNL